MSTTIAETESEGLTGKWLVTIVLEGASSQPWMIEVTESGGGYEAKILDSSLRAKTEIERLEVNDDQVTIQVSVEGQSWTFEGVNAGGRIRGTVAPRDRPALAWLERTRLRSIRSVPASAPLQGSVDYEVALTASEPDQQVERMMEFAEKHPESPLVFDAQRVVLRLGRTVKLPEEKLRGIVDRMLELATAWGRRWRDHMLETAAYDLAASEGPPDPVVDALAVEFALAAKEALPENAATYRKDLVSRAYALALLRNDRAQEAQALLDELLAKAPEEAELRYFQALTREKLGDMDAAIDALLDLWPFPLATRELPRIWKEKHGSLAGLEARLDEVYLTRSPPLTVEPYAGRPDPAANHVAVVELFSGTSCPPCVAADLAFEALGRCFQRSNLVLLQYHLNVPGPDPMTNADSEQRARYYSVTGTPAMFVSGKDSGLAGGQRHKALELFNELRADVERQLGEKCQAKIEPRVERDGDTIKLELELRDVPANEKGLVLRLFWVERQVRFTGLNGVRLHHYVVRGMPGGSDGITITEPNSIHHLTIDRADLRESLRRALSEYEKQLSEENKAEFRFPEKPLELEQLGVAVLLQDDATQAIRQARFVEVDSPASPSKAGN